MSPRFSNSELKTYKRCREEWRLNYGLLIRPVRRAAALAYGSLVHEGLEAYFLNGFELAPALAAMSRYKADELGPLDRARAEAQIMGYVSRWEDEDKEQYTTIAAEQQFKIHRQNHTFTGMIDALVRDREGRVWIVEHKTAGVDISPGADYWTKLTIDDQISAYYAGARSLGHDVEGVVYDVLGKPKQKLKRATAESRRYKKDGGLRKGARETDETPKEYRDRILMEMADSPDAYYQRTDVVRFEHEEQQSEIDRLKIITEIQTVDLEQPQPKTPESCQRYGRLCPYADFCLGHLSPYQLDDRFRRASTKHEELSTNEPTRKNPSRQTIATV